MTHTQGGFFFSQKPVSISADLGVCILRPMIRSHKIQVSLLTPHARSGTRCGGGGGGGVCVCVLVVGEGERNQETEYRNEKKRKHMMQASRQRAVRPAAAAGESHTLCGSKLY